MLVLVGSQQNLHHLRDLPGNHESVERMVGVLRQILGFLDGQLIPNLQIGNDAHYSSIKDFLLAIATVLLVTHFGIYVVLFDLPLTEHIRGSLQL